MSPEELSKTDGSLGSFEYELTDELAFAAGMAFHEHKTGQAKTNVVRSGAPHPALPLLGVSAMLVAGIAAVAILAWNSVLARVLMVAGFFVLLLLLFKTAVYFCPPFARWHVRRQALRMTRQLVPRTIRWTLLEDRLETQSARGRQTRTWGDLIALERLSDFWLLRWRDGVEFFAPTAIMPADFQAILRRKAEQAGATTQPETHAADGPVTP